MIGLSLFLLPLIAYIIKPNLLFCIILDSFILIPNLIIFKEYDIPLSMYIVVIMILYFIHYLIHYKSLFMKQYYFLFTIYILFNILLGILINNYFNVFAVVIAYLSFPIFFMMVDYDAKLIKINSKKIINIILISSIVDILISVILFFNLIHLNVRPYRTAIGGFVIGGGLAVAILPLLFRMLDEQYNNKVLILSWCLFAVSVLFSRTRGYMLIFFGTSLIYYLITRFRYKKILVYKVLIYSLIGVILVLIIWVQFDTIYSFVNYFFRIDSSLGRRGVENIYISKIFSENDILHKLFGYGIGRKACEVGDVYEYSYGTQVRQWTLNKVSQSKSFHNGWGTILFDLGFIGVLAYMFFYIYLIIMVYKISFKKRVTNITLIVYIIFLGISYFYRQTFYRYILEMIILSYSINIDIISNKKMR